ncbi:MAG: type II toxin-antitoxin system RelB/DinJ family antitoxin [Candidatus Paceibacterota bacterium]|jgi:addiction module RelB/DinJ family antitoxin
MKTVINIKADKEVKEEAVKIAGLMGLPLSTVVNAFLKKFIADQSVTFNVPSKPSKNLQKIIKQSEKDLKNGKNLSPLFTDMDKMDRYLANL